MTGRGVTALTPTYPRAQLSSQGDEPEIYSHKSLFYRPPGEVTAKMRKRLCKKCKTTISSAAEANGSNCLPIPFKSESTFATFIHYKPRIAVAGEDELMWFKITENCHVLVNQFHGNCRSNTLGSRKIKAVLGDVKSCFNAP